MRKQKGFTLIELMVVMAIISVIAVMIVGAITIARKTARDTQRRSNVKVIKVAIEAYFAKNKSLPSTGALSPGWDKLSEFNTGLGLSLTDPGATNELSFAICYRETGSTYFLRLDPESSGTAEDGRDVDASCGAVPLASQEVYDG